MTLHVLSHEKPRAEHLPTFFARKRLHLVVHHRDVHLKILELQFLSTYFTVDDLPSEISVVTVSVSCKK